MPWDAVVFLARQAGEKALKALLVAAGAAVPRTHDLVALLSVVRAEGFDVEAVRRDVDVLSRYGAAVRYPDLVYSPGEEDARGAAGAAQRLRSKIGDLLGGRDAEQDPGGASA